MLTGTFITLYSYVRKEEKSQINLSSHPKKLEKEKINPK